MPSVMQDWVQNITFMQQSVLMAAVRGPDGIDKNHVAKKLLRWLRRCTLLSAFDKRVLENPYEPGGGSFTGPSCFLATVNLVKQPCPRCVGNGWIGGQGGDTCPKCQGTGEVLNGDWEVLMHEVLDNYMLATDMIPHHFQLHFLHAAEILGYKHPDRRIGDWWLKTYHRLCRDMHLNPERRIDMETRLGDSEPAWRAEEEVRAD